MTIKRDERFAVTIEKTLKISVNKNCIMIQDDRKTSVHPASDIQEINMEINRQLVSSIKGCAYDDSAIYIGKISKDHCASIKAGAHTEEVYAFIMKNMYDMDDSDDDVSSFHSLSAARTIVSDVSGKK
jgi:hypothetical protein